MDSIDEIIRKKKFGTVNQALYWFNQHYPLKSKSEVRRAFNAYRKSRYVKKYNKSLMGNTFSHGTDSYQMDIYFTERTKIPYLLLVNVNTRYAWIHKLKSKNADDVIRVFEAFVSEHKPSEIKCDAEKAFSSFRFVDYCREHHIKLRIVLNELHSDLSIINRLCRTLRSMSEELRLSPEELVKKYNKRFHESIAMAPRDMQFDKNRELKYIYNQLELRDKKNKLLLDESNVISKHDKVRYILDEKQQRMHKNEYRYKLSKYYYRVEYVHSPYLYDIIAKDGSVKTIPRYRLYKLSDSEAETLDFAPSIEDESNFMIYDEILDYKPVFKKNGELNLNKTKYIVRSITRDKSGKKLKSSVPLSIMQLRVGSPTELTALEREYLSKHQNYKLDKSSNYIVPK